MATRIYGISQAEKHYEITEGVGSATTDDLEMTFDLATGLTREEVIIMLDKIKAYILEDDFPPA